MNKSILSLGTIFITVLILFRNVFFGLLPIPADTIIGLYHPFRDLYAKEYPNGIPYKNFLITDPVRQQYPWKNLVITMEKQLEIPVWNPYNFSGMPLLANLQSTAFYPLNSIFFFLPFSIGWTILIILQPLLGGLFLYLYLRSKLIDEKASLLGSIVFAFCGFSTAWMEWGTIGHVALWLPLLLLIVDKLTGLHAGKKYYQTLGWALLFVFSLSAAFFAGHLQTFFYLFIVVYLSILFKIVKKSKPIIAILFFSLLTLIFIAVTAIQWIPTLQLLDLSARSIDQADWHKAGWFLPWHHLIQFVAPDFFGNPTTGNYWGEWNYGEFIGYIGIIPLIFALYALFFRRDKKTLFFGSIGIVSLLLSLPTIVGQLPYMLQIPFLSTSQPTRLLFLTDFSLAILAALGVDLYIKRKKVLVFPLLLLGIILCALWILIFFFPSFFQLPANIITAKNNLILPTILYAVAILLFGIIAFFHKSTIRTSALYILLLLSLFDLLRFNQKFISFSKSEYLFPSTQAITFLQKEKFHRVMTVDSRILPPNFSSIYHIQSIDGYDPLYLRRYGELLVASERGKANIEPPFGFNRIITPRRYDSPIIDLLGVKYILSMTDIQSPSIEKVFQEGQTRVYENKRVYPRAFFVKNITRVNNKEEAIISMITKDINLRETAIVEGMESTIEKGDLSIGIVKILSYTENKIILQTKNEAEGFLILTDIFYPTWNARIIEENKEIKIFRTDYTFRGIFIPAGVKTIEFSISLF